MTRFDHAQAASTGTIALMEGSAGAPDFAGWSQPSAARHRRQTTLMLVGVALASSVLSLLVVLVAPA